MKLFRMLTVVSSLALLTGVVLTPTLAQEEHPSIHQQEAAFHAAHPEAAVHSFQKTERDEQLAKAATLTSVVYGFHPYWQNGLESNYYLSLLSHLVYFSAEIDTATGGFSNTRSWSTATVVDAAHQAGVKVHLAITLFGGHAAVLNNSARRQNLVDNIISQIDLRSAEGCNVDFESMATAVADSFRTFIVQLGTELHAHGKELVVELPAVDWSTGGVMFGTTFFTATTPVVDYYFLMAYDYYWKGSTNAGPVAPLTTGTSSYHVMRSINTYLSKGAPTSKLIAGFPYYGYDWPVTSNVRMAPTSGSGTSRTYTVIRTSYLDTIRTSDKFFDATYNVPWYRYQPAGVWRQTWYDDSASLAMKYDSVKARSLAGTGMWALGYDNGYTDLWRLLKAKFSLQPDAGFIVLDDFEASAGHFGTKPTYSGTTSGISQLSSAAQTYSVARGGAASLAVALKDSAGLASAWTVRLLSGAGTPASNVSLSASGSLGFWLRTSSAPANARVAISVDDGAGGTLISSHQSVVSDGQWHLYQWDLTSTSWTILAGTDNILNGPTCTLDAIMLYSDESGSDWKLWIDDVNANPSGPLPVSVTSFDAQGIERGAVIQWTTASEINCAGYDLERRTIPDGTLPAAWQKAGFVPGEGTSNSPKTYTWRDEGLAPGRYAYRIVQLDRSGSATVIGEMEVEVAGLPAEFVLHGNYPNPFNPSTKLTFMVSTKAQTTLSVYNVIGQKVATVFDGMAEAGREYIVEFHGESFASGVYIAVLESAGRRATWKMMLTK